MIAESHKTEPSPLTRRCEACGHRYAEKVELCLIDGRRLPPADPGVADVGSYRLMERLGDGGMGAVYRAVHRKLGRVVAIKILQRDLSADRGIINRFFHEARAANTIRHEHVIEVYDFVEGGQEIYFVMELLEGRDLHDLLHGPGGGPLDARRASSILEQIASALHAAHEREIVHRDLKPENVFLCDGRGDRDFVKVIDFGIAKLDRFDGRSTVQGAVLGTPEYIAPEQALGLSIDARSDVYSLGCVAYEMLTGRQIFGGGTRAEILTRQIDTPAPPLRTLAPAVPPALEAAVMHALAKDPALRPQSALAFAEEIAQAMGRELANRALFQRPDRRTPAPVRASTPGLRLRAGEGASRAAFRRLLAVGALAATLLLVGAAAVGRLRHPAPRSETAPGAHVASRATAEAATTATVAAAGATTVNVLLQSIPSGAEVFDDEGRSIGLTPRVLTVPAGGERQVRFRMNGFQPLERRFRAVGDTTIAVYLDAEAPARDRPSAHRHARGEARRPQVGVLESGAGTIDPFHR